MEKFTTQSLWVLHSPYTDRTWRGTESCITNREDGNVRFFESEQDALDFRTLYDHDHFTPARCLLVTPKVGQSLESVPESIEGVYKRFSPEDIEYKMEVSIEDCEVRGNFSSGHPEEDKAIEDQIIEAMERSEWAWCQVTVTASWGGIEGVDTLGGVSILPEEIPKGVSPEDYFRNDYGYYEDMKKQALQDLKETIIRNGWSFT